MLVVDTQLQQALADAAQVNQITCWLIIAIPFLLIGFSVALVLLDELIERWHERVVERLKQQYPYCAERLEQAQGGVPWKYL